MKQELTPTLLMVLYKLLKKFPKFDYIGCQSWRSNDCRTLNLLLEVTVEDPK